MLNTLPILFVLLEWNWRFVRLANNGRSQCDIMYVFGERYIIIHRQFNGKEAEGGGWGEGGNGCGCAEEGLLVFRQWGLCENFVYLYNGPK